jgi:hypothetical protein
MSTTIPAKRTQLSGVAPSQLVFAIATINA